MRDLRDLREMRDDLGPVGSELTVAFFFALLFFLANNA